MTAPIENWTFGLLTQIGQSGRWPNALNRAATWRLPAVPH